LKVTSLKGSYMTNAPLNHPVCSIHHCADAGDIAVMNSRLAQVFNVCEHGPHERGEIERFIQHCFAAAHGAHIGHFMPRLLSLRSRHGELIAAFGLRPAADSKLFLETYLDQPIEAVLQNQLRTPVRREEIVEVGNLSALYPGAARWLIVALTSLLFSEGYKWVVFTGTSSLRNGFRRLGLQPVTLGAATLDRLPSSQRLDWGSYYDHAPVVMAGNIEYGYHALLMQRELTALLRAGIDSIDADDQA
jgi:hypothetical protein